jgi:hypothetical protein
LWREGNFIPFHFTPIPIFSLYTIKGEEEIREVIWSSKIHRHKEAGKKPNGRGLAGSVLPFVEPEVF